MLNADYIKTLVDSVFEEKDATEKERKRWLEAALREVERTTRHLAMSKVYDLANQINDIDVK